MSDRRQVALSATIYRMTFAHAKWLRDALTYSGLTQTDLANQLTRRLGRAIDKAAVNKMCIMRPKSGQKRRKIGADEMQAIEEITGYLAPFERNAAIRLVPLVSWVSAGRLTRAEAVTSPDILQELKIADLPPGGDWIALKVQGNSMNLVVRPGGTIFVNRNDRELVSERYYVVITEGGEATFKLYRAKPYPRLQPQSTNPDHETQPLSEEMSVVGRVHRAIVDL